jgi:hypothetical protein
MLSWQPAAWLTLALLGLAVGVARAPWAGLRALRPVAVECAIVGGLYTLWQLAGTLSVLGSGGAIARARWIERTERAVHLPAEADVQSLIHNPALAQAANVYYASMHFGALFVFLLWLFFRHRDQYRPIRRVLALTTFVCLAIQLVPVAPPRMLPGYVDTAAKYGQSVYDNSFGFGADQLSAMPSVHVAWAVLIGWATVRVGSGLWRWLGPAHAVLTVLVVVATANHWWADGVVAVAVLALCAAAERAVRIAFTRTPPANRVEDAPEAEDPALMEAT